MTDDQTNDITDDADTKQPAPRTKPKRKGGFFPFFNKSTKAIKQSSAGAGFVGLIGFAVMTLIASVFFITENYFVSMFTISIGLIIYVTGLESIVLFFSTFIIFISSKHLNAKASSMQETLVALRNILNIRRGRDGNITVGPVDSDIPIVLPDNSLSRDIQELVAVGKNFDYAEFVAHSYYVECHELYESIDIDATLADAAIEEQRQPKFDAGGTIGNFRKVIPAGLLGFQQSMRLFVKTERAMICRDNLQVVKPQSPPQCLLALPIPERRCHHVPGAVESGPIVFRVVQEQIMRAGFGECRYAAVARFDNRRQRFLRG